MNKEVFIKLFTTRKLIIRRKIMDEIWTYYCCGTDDDYSIYEKDRVRIMRTDYDALEMYHLLLSFPNEYKLDYGDTLCEWSYHE